MVELAPKMLGARSKDVTINVGLDGDNGIRVSPSKRDPPGSRVFGGLPPRLRVKMKWAFLSAVSTSLISMWCLESKTRDLLPSSAFGAYVTIFLTERNLGRTLRCSADCLLGASIAVPVAWLAATYVHGTNEILTGLALFLQSLLWAYVEVPVPFKRLALSTMVIVCLTAQRRPEGLPLEHCAKLILLVALSASFALFTALIPLGPQLASSRAVRLSQATWRTAQLNIEKTVSAFLETDGRRQHITAVQLNELNRSARKGASELATCLEDARWEPPRLCSPDSLSRLHNDFQALEKVLDLADAVQRTLVNLPFNMCHMAFVTHLRHSLVKLTSAVCALLNAPDPNSQSAAEAHSDIAKALETLHEDYAHARRDLLYPEKPHAIQSPGLVLSMVNWNMEDLLHLNTFLFTTMHLAAHVSSYYQYCWCSGPLSSANHIRTSTWASYAVGLIRVLRPPWPFRLDFVRLRSATRFAFAITLAALLCLAPPVSSYFEQEIWAPVEVTFLMFKYGGGSLRQSLLRLQGALLGSVVGYIIVLVLSTHHHGWVVGCLSLWSFCACLFRSSDTHGYAAIVAAWTAVIVTTAGVAPGNQGMSAQVPALERMTHTVVGVASLVLAIAVVFPSWARDAARKEMVSLLGGFEKLHDALQQAWIERSQKMQADPANDEHDSEAHKLLGPPDDEHGQSLVSVDVKNQEKLFSALRRQLASFQSLIEEASMEPSLWRPPYQAEASRQVARLLEEMLCWLRMFGMYVTSLAGGESPVLQRIFGGQKPRRWLSEAWIKSLQDTNKQITGMLSELENALKGGKHRGNSMSGQEQPYLNAILVERLESNLRHELGSFLQRYHLILNSAISDSQLKIQSGQQTDPFLTNMDMLFYNSLIFATQGFARELLRCSRGVRDLVLISVGIAEASDISEIQALALPPKLLEEILGKNDARLKVSATSSSCDPSPFGTSSNLTALENVEVLQLVFSIVGFDREGIVYDVVRTIFEHGGTVSASRMAKLENDLAFLMQVTAPKASAMALEGEVRAVLKGLQVSTKVARDEITKPPPYQAEVCCICPKDVPGLLMRLTSVLDGFGLDILTLDTALRPTLTGLGFLMVARIGASVSIDETLLCERLDSIQEGVNISINCFQTHWSTQAGSNLEAEIQKLERESDLGSRRGVES